jgi:GT2 family glycosyltransferase
VTEMPRLDGRAAVGVPADRWQPPTATEPVARTAAVVLNWNGWRDTIPCVESLRAAEGAPRVVVVDNGSSDDSVAHICSATPWVRLVRLPSNRGFSGGMNAGISVALEQDPPVEYIWVLNNDTVVQRETLSRMMAIADCDPAVGIVGCRLIDADGSGRVQALGGGGLCRWLGTTSTYVRPTARSCDHLIGASLLLRRAVLSELGGFDERYFFYLEDTDLSLRARRAGWRLAVAHSATVIHRRGASINDGSQARSLRSDVSFARSSAIFVSSLDLPWRITAIPLRLAGMLANRLARAQVDRVGPITRAYLDGLRIGRRSPRIPSFSTERSRGPAQPEPADATAGGSRSE